MKQLFLTVLMISFALFGYSQTVTYKTYNYIDDADNISVIREKFGSRVGLKIEDINKKLVDISKDIKQTTFNETVPSLFETFAKATLPGSEPASAGLSKGAVALLDAGDITNAKISDPIRVKLVALNALYIKTANSVYSNDGLLTGYKETYENMKIVLQYQSDLILLQNNCSKKFAGILADVAKETLTTFSATDMQASDRMLLSNLDYSTNKGVLNRYLGQLLIKSKKNYDDVIAAYAPSKKDELTKSITSIQTQILQAIGLLEKLQAKGDAHVRALLAKLKSERDAQELKNLFEDAMDRYSKVDVVKLHSDMEAFNATGKKELFAVYDYFTVSNWIYYVEPQNIDGDLTVITVNVTPKAEVPCSPLPRSYQLKIRAKSGLKIDFSTGLFTNFGGSKFIDQTYKYEEVDVDSYKIVRNDAKNTIFPSVGALMHFYKRTGREVNLAGTFGISTKDLEKINYHLGGSLIFGYSQRFIISSGMTLTKATLIDDKYREDQIIPKSGAPDAIPTSSFNRLGFFVGFTYNLTAK